MKSTVKLYSLNYTEVQTYLTALMFVAGNLSLIHISEPTRPY